MPIDSGEYKCWLNTDPLFTLEKSFSIINLLVISWFFFLNLLKIFIIYYLKIKLQYYDICLPNLFLFLLNMLLLN